MPFSQKANDFLEIIVPKGLKQKKDSFAILQQEVQSCQKCPLSKSRHNIVFGSGNKKADILFVGEAPGEKEDETGIPFVGKAGQLLDLMLQAIDIKRDDVFIANVLKCRPPQNRDPSIEEVSLCTPFLLRQITLIEPKIIVALGRIAANFLLKTNQSMSNLRQKIFTDTEFQKPIMVTFHPAYLLRSPREKERACEDFFFIQDYIKNHVC